MEEEENHDHHGRNTGSEDSSPRSAGRGQIRSDRDGVPEVEQTQGVLHPLNHAVPTAEENTPRAPCTQQIKSALRRMVGFHPKLRSPQRTPEKDTLKHKRTKRKKTCRKKGLDRVTERGETTGSLVDAETENAATEAGAALSSIAGSVNRLEHAYLESIQSRLSPETEAVLGMDTDYEEEFELVAEVRLCDSGDSGICSISRFGRDTNLRNKSAFLVPSSHRREKNSSCGNKTSSILHSLAYRSGAFVDLLQNSSSLCSPPADSVDHLQPELCIKSRTRVLQDINLQHHNQRTKGTDTTLGNDCRFPFLMPRLINLPHFIVDHYHSNPDSNNSCIFGTGKTPVTSTDSHVKRLAGDEKNPSTSKDNGWGVVLGNGSGVFNGQQRPLTGEGGSASGNQPSQSTSNAVESVDSNPPHSQNLSASSSTYAAGSGELDIYDPFHPTDEENVNGDLECDPEEEREQKDEEHDDQKYDPFEPTGSNPSSPESNSALDCEKESSQDRETNSEMHVEMCQESSDWCIPSSEDKEGPLEGFVLAPLALSHEDLIEPLTPTDAYSPSAEYVSEEHEGIVEPLTPTDAYSPSAEYVSEEHEGLVEPLTPTDAYSPSAEYVSEAHESTVGPLTPTDAYSPSAEYVSEAHESTVGPLTPTDAYSPSAEYVSEAHESTVGPLTPTDAYSPSAEYVSEAHESTVGPLTPTDAYSPSAEYVSEAHESTVEPLTPTDAYSPSAEYESVAHEDIIEPLSPTDAYSPSAEYASAEDSGIVEPLTPTDAYSPIEVEDLSSDSAPEDETSCRTGNEFSPAWKSSCNLEPKKPDSEPECDEDKQKTLGNKLNETVDLTEEPDASPVQIEENSLEQREPSKTPERTYSKLISVEGPGSKKEHRARQTSETDYKSKMEVRVSPEPKAADSEELEHKSYSRPQRMTITITDTRSRHKSRHFSDRRDEGDYLYEDSEIEEGEIVQPEEDRFSPVRTFRARGRISDRPLRVVEGDDFLSLHADSDEERALQIDFAEGQSDTRWKGIDLRRKITNQRRERYRKRSRSKSPAKKHSGSRSGSSSRSRKKSKKARNQSKSVERKHSKSKESRSKAKSGTHRKKSKSRDRKRCDSKSHRKMSRSRSREHRRSKSWSPVSTSVSIVGSLRTSAERRRSRRSRSKERGYPKSRSASEDRARKEKYREKHHMDDKSHKRKRSRSKSRDREKRSDHHSSSRRSKERHEKEKDKKRERHSGIERKHETSLSDRRRDSRGVVPPSIQDLNDDDLFTIKRTITVNPEEKLDDHSDLLDTLEGGGKREVLYDSEGLSFETSFSDREHPDERDGKGIRVLDRHLSKLESGKRKSDYDRWKEEEFKLKLSKDAERRRSRGEEKPSREKRKKKLRETMKPDLESVMTEKDKVYPEKEKLSKKLKAGHKDGSTRKVKLQSKVAVLIREGVSSTTSVKEAGSIGVKFSRDRESRSPFIKSEEKVANLKVTRPKLEILDPKDIVVKPKKIKVVKVKTGIKKVKAAVTESKLKGPEKKKKKLKTKGSLKKSKADSCSKEPSSPTIAKEESSWSGSEKSDSKGKPPSPPKPANEQELTPDSQTVDSSCKTPDVSFLPEEPKQEQQSSEIPMVDSVSEVEEQPRAPLTPPMSWNLQPGMDCTASGVLALTALLFKMEEANMASRAKAKELIQASNQIFCQTKPSTPLSSQSSSSAFLPTSQPPAPYVLHSSLPSSTPSTPLDLPSSIGQVSTNTTSGFFYTTSSNMESGREEGSIYSDGKADADKVGWIQQHSPPSPYGTPQDHLPSKQYLKKLHMQERAIEEVKLAIKPYYQKKEVTKDEYKDILRKAVHKICHSKSGEINPVKVNNLIKAYVQRYKYFRKHGRRMDDEEEGSGSRGGRDIGHLDKFPLPPM